MSGFLIRICAQNKDRGIGGGEEGERRGSLEREVEKRRILEARGGGKTKSLAMGHFPLPFFSFFYFLFYYFSFFQLGKNNQNL